MSGIEIGAVSVILIIGLIYAGLYVPIALGLVSFLGVWIIRANIEKPISLVAQATADTVSGYFFATVPLFVMMGLLVSKSGLGRDIYQVANRAFYRLRGGLGIATVAANAVFASVTGSSIASASVFARVSVPEMRRFHYGRRFSVGVVAGSSVLGMLIPPSVMLIIYAVVAEQSVGQMFIAGIIPGIVLSAAYGVAILALAYGAPLFVGGRRPGVPAPDPEPLAAMATIAKMAPIVILVVLVLGGIYGGVFTPTEAGAAGALAALVIALVKRRIGWAGLWEVLIETG
ncbi:MAG: TRAP transporter large permease subunit, partial [Alphaproteobacteria bacterium]